MGQIKQMMQVVKSAGNPQAMLNQLMMTNPNMRQVMEIVQRYGGDPMTAFRETARERGIDPQEILDMMK